MNDSIRIQVEENGYTVECRDPKIDAENSKPKTPWKDPWKTYVFGTLDALKEFIEEHLESMKPPPSSDAEFDAGFSAATQEDD